MARVNKSRYAVLGMLSFGKGSGYDIKKKMEMTNGFWSESDGAIYPILTGLLDEGLVTCEVENVDTGKPKKIYELTDDGLAELQDWLKLTPEISPGRNELILKLFFGNNIDKEVSKKHIENFKRFAEEKLEHLKEIEERFKKAGLDEENITRYIALKAGLAYTQCGLDWCDESIRLLNDI